MKKRRKVTKGAPRVKVPLIGWAAARVMANTLGKTTQRLDSVEAAAYVTFRQADQVVREEGRNLLRRYKETTADKPHAKPEVEK